MADEDTILARLKVQNGAGFRSEMKETAGSVDALGSATERTAKKTEFARLETFAWTTGVRLLRTHIYAGVFAIEAFATESIHLGLAFDEAKSKGEAAFTGILGDASAARREMTELVGISQEVGFQLPDLTNEATRMLDFGFSVEQVNKQLKAFSLFSQKRDLGFGGVTGLTNIFAQIEQQGQLTGRTMMSLIHLGVPVLDILQKQLGLTEKQVNAIRKNKLAIPSRLALPALTLGLGQTPGELGLTGELGRVRAIFAHVAGDAEAGLFTGVSAFVGRIADRLERGLAATKGGGGVHAFLLGFDPSGRLLRDWNNLAAVVTGVTSALTGAFKIGRAVLGLFTGLSTADGTLTGKTTVLKYAVEALTYSYIAWRTTTIIGIAYMKAEAFWLGVVAAATKVYEFWVLRAEYAQLGLNVAMDTNPVVAFAIGIAALSVGMYILYTRVEAFRDAVNGTFSWIESHWPLLGGLILMPFIGPVALILSQLGRIKNWLVSLLDWLGHNVFSLRFAIKLGGGLLGLAGKGLSLIDGAFADGGDAMAGGKYLVGERGPEIFAPKTSGRVSPIAGGLDRLIQVAVSIIPADVRLDGKKVGQITFQYATDVQAR